LGRVLRLEQGPRLVSHARQLILLRNDQCLTALGKHSLRRKFPRL